MSPNIRADRASRACRAARRTRSLSGVEWTGGGSPRNRRAPGFAAGHTLLGECRPRFVPRRPTPAERLHHAPPAEGCKERGRRVERDIRCSTVPTAGGASAADRPPPEGSDLRSTLDSTYLANFTSIPLAWGRFSRLPPLRSMTAMPKPPHAQSACRTPASRSTSKSGVVVPWYDGQSRPAACVGWRCWRRQPRAAGLRSARPARRPRRSQARQHPRRPSRRKIPTR